jgi:hypothetical protein
MLVWSGLFLLVASAQGQSRVALAWAPGTSRLLAGYRLYSGGASRTYTNMIDVGNATTNSITGLAAGVTYFFAVTTYDSTGLESDFSSEVSYTVPSSLKISRSWSGTPPPGGPVITLSATGQPGQRFDVLSSRDFALWTLIGTMALDANGFGQFVDAACTNIPSCVYRLQGQ